MLSNVACESSWADVPTAYVMLFGGMWCLLLWPVVSTAAFRASADKSRCLAHVLSALLDLANSLISEVGVDRGIAIDGMHGDYNL